MADRDNSVDWPNQVAVSAVLAFALSGGVCVVKTFVGVWRGENSPLEAVAFFVMLAGFWTGNLPTVGVGCLLLFVGVLHTHFMNPD